MSGGEAKGRGRGGPWTTRTTLYFHCWSAKRKGFDFGANGGDRGDFSLFNPAASVFWLMLSTDFGLVATQNETKCRQSVIWLQKSRKDRNCSLSFRTAGWQDERTAGISTGVEAPNVLQATKDSAAELMKPIN